MAGYSLLHTAQQNRNCNIFLDNGIKRTAYFLSDCCVLFWAHIRGQELQNQPDLDMVLLFQISILHFGICNQWTSDKHWTVFCITKKGDLNNNFAYSTTLGTISQAYTSKRRINKGVKNQESLNSLSSESWWSSWDVRILPQVATRTNRNWPQH